MNKKQFLIISVLSLIILGSISTLALAFYQPPMVVQINPNGGITLRGDITAINTNSITVKSWGGSWLVNILPTTNLMPIKDLSQFKVGDFIGVQGTVNQNSPWTIDAVIFRDWTYKKVQNNNLSISGISGPTTLNVNQSGSWTINVNNSQNSNLSYYVVWGDENNYAAPATTNKNGEEPNIYVQTATFTHTYLYAGAFNPKFYVRDNLGNSTNVSISINVGNVPVPVSMQPCTSNSQCSGQLVGCWAVNSCSGGLIAGSVGRPGTCQIPVDCAGGPPPSNSQKADANGNCPAGYVNYGVPLGCVTQDYKNYCSSHASQCPE